MHFHIYFLLPYVLGMCLTVVCSLRAANEEIATINSALETVQRELKEVFNELESLSSKTVESKTLPRDCADVLINGAKTSGVYTVYIGIMKHPVQVYCDMTTDFGGWTVFQRRQDGSVDFYRNWADYKNGFGELSGEHWLGNDILHKLTNSRTYRLRVELGDWNNNTRYAEYNNFTVASACQNYKLLSVGDFGGPAGDSLGSNVGQMFSTFDNDQSPSGCAAANKGKGAWWYIDCGDSNLNGPYLNGQQQALDSYGDVSWKAWLGNEYSLKFSQMKIRPVDM